MCQIKRCSANHPGQLVNGIVQGQLGVDQAGLGEVLLGLSLAQPGDGDRADIDLVPHLAELAADCSLGRPRRLQRVLGGQHTGIGRCDSAHQLLAYTLKPDLCGDHLDLPHLESIEQIPSEEWLTQRQAVGIGVVVLLQLAARPGGKELRFDLAVDARRAAGRRYGGQQRGPAQSVGVQPGGFFCLGGAKHGIMGQCQRPDVVRRLRAVSGLRRRHGGACGQTQHPDRQKAKDHRESPESSLCDRCAG